MTKTVGEDWVGAPALAKELGVTMRTLYKILDAGDLPAYRIGRVIRIKRADIESFLESVKVGPGDLRHLFPLGRTTRRGSAEVGPPRLLGQIPKYVLFVPMLPRIIRP